MNSELVYWIIAVWFTAMPIPCIVIWAGNLVKDAWKRAHTERLNPTALRVEVIPGTANGYRINARGGVTNVQKRRPY